ncbi:MAG: hypothetical protein AMS21_09335 [Gemmatimonas sp. SG8_38_2]|nr:MAG: hypothetical protein AMS21_09335 [Gemmatimonas sp. SG8_38_2]
MVRVGQRWLHGTAFFLLLLLAAEAAGQESAADSVSLMPGPDYAAGSFHRFFWGDHYRDAWTTEIQVPVLDLETFAGGLTPISAGGGLQTKSLWLRGADGKVYAFRSIYKKATELVPQVLRDTYVEDLLQDQMSSQHPFAPLIVEELMNAASVLHSEPSLYVLPDDASLGEFQADFGGILGTLAERPIDYDGAIAAFVGAEEIVDGFEVVIRVMADPSMRVDSREFLTARLIDVLVGDWDRHADQWRWADLGSDSTTGWQPIPSDRDQAFARLDGVVLAVVRSRTPMLTSFREKYDSPSRLHYQARFIDRLFLTELERPVWDSIATHLAGRITDDVIERAVARLPEEVHAVDGPFLVSMLEARRDALPEIAGDLYELLAREPYVHASAVTDVARVVGSGDGVTVTLRAADSGAEPYFRRTFLQEETKDLRIYLHEGDDRAIVSGEGKSPIRVNIIGGPGDDTFEFDSRVKNVHLYDQYGTNRVAGSSDGVGINGRRYTETLLVPEKGTRAPPRHWGDFGFPFFTGGYTPDVGLFAGASYEWVDYGFRKDPNASAVAVSGAISTKLKFALAVDGEFRFENSPLLVGLDAMASSFQTVNFYGIGNDREFIPGTSTSFYKVENTRLEGEATLRADVGGVLDFGGGLVGAFSNTKDDPNTFLGQNPDTYGTGQFGQAGAIVRLDLHTRRPGALVETGNAARASLVLRAEAYPALIGVEETYGFIDAVTAASLPLGVRRWEVGLRAGGRKIWGQAPFFQLAYIGGIRSLRGWVQERFAGDASLYGNAELRLDLFNYRIVFPSTFGILGLFDAGRVWVDGESPGDWHTAYGGGVWLALRGTRSIVSVAYANSDEDDLLYVTFGFPF